jgi:hypothetical protein
LIAVTAGHRGHLHGYIAIGEIKAKETTPCNGIETPRSIAKKPQIGVRD